MAYTEVTEQGWFSRIRGSIKGMFVGVLFLLGGIYLLFAGEGRAVRRAKALAEGATTVISASPQGPESSAQGKLVHVSGQLQSPGSRDDRLFGVRVADAIRLERQVEMYQWRENVRSETKKKLGGKTETVKTYDYEKVWSSSAIDSSSFKVREGHENPPKRFDNDSWVAENVYLGGWELGDVFVGKLNRRMALPIGEEELEAAPSSLRDSLHLTDGGFFYGWEPSSPEVGDLKISWEVVETSEVSIVGKQNGKVLESFRTSNDGSISLLSYGIVAADVMFESAKSGNATLTWILRAVGLFILFLGWRMILTPLQIVADVVPLAGRIVGAGVGFIAFGLALISTLGTVALGWLYYRPLVGVFLLAMCGALIFWLVKKARAASIPEPAATAGSPPPPPPPPVSV